MEANEKIKIGITHGDINGISYEIILKSLKDSRIYSNFVPIIYGSPKVAAYYKKVFKYNSINITHIKDITEIEPETINMFNCVSNEIRVQIGKSTKEAGASSLQALQRAVADLKENKIDILITAPINKHNIQSEEFDFKGHTHYLKSEFESEDVVMLMVADKLRIAVATDHVPVRSISENLSIDLIHSKLQVLHQTLQRDFGILHPKIAVLGLNPHAGDNGLIGNEELEIIQPAITKAISEGIIVMGTYAADGFFGSHTYREFDAVLAMYHDQGLAPFKILSNGGGVNYTGGLPIVRTSPAHGTAYDIAGKHVAKHTSMKDAIYTAIDIYNNRKQFDQIKPLEKQSSEE